MRILLVGINYAPEVVGIGPYTTELAEHFADEGHQVTALTGLPYYPHWRVDSRYQRKRPYSVEVIRGVRVIRCPFLLPGMRQSSLRRIVFDSSFALSALIGSSVLGRLDVVICISPPLQLGITALLIARSRGARLLLHLQDIVPDAALSAGIMREGSLLGIGRQLERFVYLHVDAITVISQGFVENLVGKGVSRTKIELLSNWVETSLFNIAPEPSVREALGATNGQSLVLHTGNMGAKQGLSTVLDAAAELAGENVMFTLIGDGSNRAALEARVAQLTLTNVKFLPLQVDLPATLAAADILVLAQLGPVVDSVAPSKLLSYMASGKPVIASVNRLSEAGQIIQESNCGLVVPPEQPHALADALRDVLHRPETYGDLGQAGRRFVSEHHERSAILQRWSELVLKAGAR